VTAALTLLPSVALACPVCIADNPTTGTVKLLAIFIAVPFVIALIVIPMIVRAVRQAGP
jgi:hypothetical protein